MNKQQTRLRWACRRGMLELDLILGPFLENHFAELSDDEKSLFEQLLTCHDQDLSDWLMQRSVPEDPALAHMVKKILCTNSN